MGEATGTVTGILRRKFAPEEVGKLPRVTCPDCSDRRKDCAKHSKSRCNVCQAWVSEKHIHIDYVGHADVTSRLLDADGEWNWEPKVKDVDPAVLAAAVATGNPDVVKAVLDSAPPKFDLDDHGNPVGLWILLTVGGVTRPGYGSVPSGQADAVKVLIGDALRNAAMRFGVALDLWAKGDRDDPAAENATASAGRASRGGTQRESFDNARPANGNGRTVRPAADQQQPSGPAELDPDAQPYADEAQQARKLAALKDINTRAREAHKLAALVTDPESGRTGGLGQYIGFRKRQLEDVEAALAGLNDVAKKKRISIGEVDVQVKLITGKNIEDATAAEMRQAAEQMLAEVAA